MRITNRIRRYMKEALIEHAFGSRIKDLQKREEDLALKLYRTKMPEALEKKCDRLAEEIIRSFGDPDDRRVFTLVGSVEVYPSEREWPKSAQLKMSHRRPYLQHHICASVSYYDLPLELQQELDLYWIDFDKLKAEKVAAESEIKATLATFHVLRKLEEVWPDAMPVLRPVLEERGNMPEAQPIAISTENLNTTLDLPPKNKLAENDEIDIPAYALASARKAFPPPLDEAC